MSERQVLDSYLRYDGLNADREHPMIKILVSYIKPSFLFKSRIFEPIHLGRAVERDPSKDGTVDESGIKWLHENCRGDDDVEESLSPMNRRIGFFTGTYWAWKNYARLGNPEYFGNFGYRRILCADFLPLLGTIDVVAPRLTSVGAGTQKEETISAHGEEAFEVMRESLSRTHREDLGLFDCYMDLVHGYYYELYVMRKTIFFQFCEWVYPVVRELLAYDRFIGETRVITLLRDFIGTECGIKGEVPFPEKEYRDVAYILERLTGFFLYKVRMQISVPRFLEVDFFDGAKKAGENRFFGPILQGMRAHVRKSAGFGRAHMSKDCLE